MRTPSSGVRPRGNQLVAAFGTAANATSAPAGSVVTTAGTGHVEPQLPQVRIIGHDVQRLTREKERLGIVTMIREPLNLGRGDGARPASAGCGHAPSPAPGRDREDHQQRGHHHHRPAEEREQAGWRRQVPRPDDRVEGGHDIGRPSQTGRPGIWPGTGARCATALAISPDSASERSGGCSVKTASRVPSVLSPLNGRRPASIS